MQVTSKNLKKIQAVNSSPDSRLSNFGTPHAHFNRVSSCGETKVSMHKTINQYEGTSYRSDRLKIANGEFIIYIAVLCTCVGQYNYETYWIWLTALKQQLNIFLKMFTLNYADRHWCYMISVTASLLICITVLYEFSVGNLYFGVPKDSSCVFVQTECVVMFTRGCKTWQWSSITRNNIKYIFKNKVWQYLFELKRRVLNYID